MAYNYIYKSHHVFSFFCKLTQHEIIKPNPKSKHVNLVQNQSATKTISANPTVPESDYPS